ncbi:MAG: hypothetical protein HY305_05785 [Sphingobacteriales bacterium]|nr:hypothetical protein [Sphingobacteriales bacterium]
MYLQGKKYCICLAQKDFDADLDHLKQRFMYTHIWNKYLPVIRILLKKSATGNQTLDLNRVDFERAGSGRKAGYKFDIQYEDGRVGNVISGSDLASNLAAVMLEDTGTKAILKDNNYTVSLNTRFQLLIKNTSPAKETDANTEAAATTAE